MPLRKEDSNVRIFLPTFIFGLVSIYIGTVKSSGLMALATLCVWLSSNEIFQ